MIQPPILEEAPPTRGTDAPSRWCPALFLDAPVRPLTWRAGLLAAAAVVIGTLTGLQRTGGFGALDTIWAEDGQVYLVEAVGTSFLSALVTPYAGYYQVLPRVLSEPAAFLPAHWAAEYFSVTAAGFTMLLALVIYVASRAYFSSPLPRLVAAGIAVVPPVAMMDLPNSVANVHWAGLYALFWLLLWVPSGRVGRTVAAVLAVMVAATNILSLVFVPLALARIVVRRDWYSKILGVLVSAGALTHVLGLALGVSKRHTEPNLPTAAGAFMRRVVPGELLGETWLGNEVTAPWQHQWLIAVVAWLIVVASVALAATHRTRPRWSLAALAGGYSVVFWMVAAGGTGALLPRYASTAGMLLVAALVALLLPEPQGWSTGPMAAFATLLAVVCAVNLQVHSFRSEGPRWSSEVQAARARCNNSGAEWVDVLIAPHAMPQLGMPQWAAHLPCSYVKR